MGICRKAVANCLLRSEIIVYIVDRLCCAVYNVNYFALRNTQEMFPGYFALLWECNSNFIRLSKTLETRMVPAFFAFLGYRFGMMEIGRICGKVGKNLVRELVKSFTNF